MGIEPPENERAMDELPLKKLRASKEFMMDRFEGLIELIVILLCVVSSHIFLILAPGHSKVSSSVKCRNKVSFRRPQETDSG